MGLVKKFRHGGVEYPLTDATTNGLLEDADPALFYAAQLFESVLETYVEPRLLAQTALEGWRLPSAVETTIHFEPTPFLLSDKFNFPILCVYRVEETWTQQNVAFDRSDSIWEWAYVLPPMTPVEIEKLHPILRSVAVTICTFANQSFDPEFEAGATLRDLSGIQKMIAGPVRYGVWEAIDKQDKWWRTVTGKLLVQERDDIVTEEFGSFDGVNIHIDETSPDGTQLVDFVEAQTSGPPTVESVAPLSGDKAGSVPMIILGTGFIASPAPKVLVGGAYASNVVVTHPTRLTCLSPEHEAYPTFAGDVQVINDDGQESNVLEGAFTFTTP